MPIYEFYCARCHAVFSFLSRTVDTDKRPDCPDCGAPRLERRASAFAVSRGRSAAVVDGESPDAAAGIDEARLGRAMEQLAREAEGVDEENPRGVARLMQRFYDSTGLQLGPGMREALRRLEAGEDPEAIEAELGDVLEQEDPLGAVEGGPDGPGTARRRSRPPRVDPTLHEL